MYTIIIYNDSILIILMSLSDLRKNKDLHFSIHIPVALFYSCSKLFGSAVKRYKCNTQNPELPFQILCMGMGTVLGRAMECETSWDGGMQPDLANGALSVITFIFNNG